MLPASPPSSPGPAVISSTSSAYPTWKSTLKMQSHCLQVRTSNEKDSTMETA